MKLNSAIIAALTLLFLIQSSSGQSPPAAHAPTYYLRSMPAPMPFDPYQGAEPIIVLDYNKQIYQVQDNSNDYQMLMTARELDAMIASSPTTTSGTMTTSDTASPPSVDPGSTNSGGGTFTNGSQSQLITIGTNDLWIELVQVDFTNLLATLLLHNSEPGEHYQLLSTNNLSSDGQDWTLGEIVTGAADTNVTSFDLFNIGTNSQMYFRAHHGNAFLAIAATVPNAFEPNPATGDPGQTGSFALFDEYPLTNDLVVHYLISGTAQNGIDYSNIPGTVTLTANNSSSNIDIIPLFDSQIDGIETVTLTIQPTNSYLIDAGNSSATLTIADSSTTISVFRTGGDAIKPEGPPSEPAVASQFEFFRTDMRNSFPPMTAYYVVSGKASNGEDYTLLSGAVDFPDQVGNTILDVNPLSGDYDGIETVTVTLIPTNSYLVDPYGSNATLNIDDSSTTVKIQKAQDAIETNSTLAVGQTGIFSVSRTDTRDDSPPMTVNYLISGTASNGVDYQTLSGTVTFADGATNININVQTIQDDLLEGDETVTLTLIPNGNAFLLGNASNATVVIHDTVQFLTVSNLFAPIGIDYDPLTNSLMASFNYFAGSPTFARIYTNIIMSGGVPVTNTVITNWSGVGGLPDEVYLTVVKGNGASAGFTNGDMYYGSSTGIGWLSADGTRSNLNWCVLTNSSVSNALTLRGGICMDQTGTFSNYIIAVTSAGNPDGTVKGVWLVDPHAQPTLLINIMTPHLEGVTTLTNDAQKWGPWAGTIITGDEDHKDPITFANDPTIYSVALNGALTTTETRSLIPSGIYPEDFTVIPTNQNLYLTAFLTNAIMELPAHYLAPYVGDLLVTDAGKNEASGAPGLFIIRWDSQSTNFVTISIPISSAIGGQIEHTAFAPITFPGH